MTASLLEQLADLPKAEVDALIRAMAPREANAVGGEPSATGQRGSSRSVVGSTWDFTIACAQGLGLYLLRHSWLALATAAGSLTGIACTASRRPANSSV